MPEPPTPEDRLTGALLVAATLAAAIRLRGEPIANTPKVVATIHESVKLARNGAPHPQPRLTRSTFASAKAISCRQDRQEHPATCTKRSTEERRPSATTIAHIRNVLNSIFSHAATKGVIAANPVAGAKITERVKPANPTHKYTMFEVRDILTALDGHPQALVAIGLCYFGGLRPGEARAVRWENYDGQKLYVQASAWRRHVTTPKTAESAQSVPVNRHLRGLLFQLWQAEGQPTEGYILRGQRGSP
jgi:integrase